MSSTSRNDTENTFNPEQTMYQQRSGHHIIDPTEEIKENPDPKQMKLETSAQQRADSSVAVCEGSFNSNPSGREILVSRAEKLMEEYHGKVAKDEEEIGKKKEMIQAAADQMIMKLEEGNYQARVNLQTTISGIFQELQQHLEMIEPVEEELASFTAGLEMFFKDIK